MRSAYFLGAAGEERETAGSLPFGFAQGRNDKPEKQVQKQKQRQKQISCGNDNKNGNSKSNDKGSVVAQRKTAGGA